MLYHSTRNKDVFVDSADAVIQGITPDGGLFVPTEIPSVDWKSLLELDSLQMQTKILSAFLPEIPNMNQLVEQAYFQKFDTSDLTPTVKAGNFHVLELFHGPTYAFKDVALCMLPQLLVAARKAKGSDKPARILTATSGDTGKAAMSGFADVEGISICVFFPNKGVSAIQKQQMITQVGSNIKAAAVNGNFDDIQSQVKSIFINNKNKDLEYNLTSANSINIGRLAPQIMYYFKAYKDMVSDGTIAVGDKVNFSVPTGNFGDILAGYLAKQLGLPIKRLICAANANNVLTDFIKTGTYNKVRPLVKTTSPSMDILISSNLERLLYFMSEDVNLVASLMQSLENDGQYTVPAKMLKELQELFWSDFCDNEQTQKVIGSVYSQNNYLMDPHTSCGWYAAQKYQEQTGDKTPMVVLSTALPYKFPAAVLRAIGQNPADDDFEQLHQLYNVSGIEIPPNLANLKEMQVLHKSIIDVADMETFSLN